MKLIPVLILLFLGCSSFDGRSSSNKKPCPCKKDSTKSETSNNNASQSPDESASESQEGEDGTFTREGAGSSSQEIVSQPVYYGDERPTRNSQSLSQYLEFLHSQPRNCAFSNLPSQVIETCNKDNMTYRLEPKENADMYYFELMRSKNYTERRKGYSYFQNQCNTEIPFLEFMEKRITSQELNDWEKKEIGFIIEACQGAHLAKTSTDYKETSFYPNPDYSHGNGDLNLSFGNNREGTEQIKYTIEAEKGKVITPDDSSQWSYNVPAGATLDSLIPLTIVGQKEINLKISEESSSGKRDYKLTGFLHSKDRGFAPRVRVSGRPYPVYFFSENPNLKLKAQAFQLKDGALLAESPMSIQEKQDDLFVYKANLDLGDFGGKMEVKIEKEQE